jgi:hypothetical protein
MRLDDVFVKEFKEAYEKEYGESITDKEAREKFFRLVNLLRTIIYGTPSNKPENHPSGPSSVDKSDFNANLKD